jgi:hypothetical protein
MTLSLLIIASLQTVPPFQLVAFSLITVSLLLYLSSS